jgi:hypothetical protein
VTRGKNRRGNDGDEDEAQTDESVAPPVKPKVRKDTVHVKREPSRSRPASKMPVKKSRDDQEDEDEDEDIVEIVEPKPKLRARAPPKRAQTWVDRGKSKL